jgi:hypothetical protein
MAHGGNRNGGRVELEIGGQQFANGRKDGDRVFGRGVGGARRVRLDCSDQGNVYTGGIGPRRLQLAVDAEMVFTKGPGPGNGNAQCGFAGYSAASVSGPLPSTTLRQRL